MKAEFDKAGARIVVMSFGSREAAIQWRQETSCQYPILLDPDRQVRWQPSFLFAVIKLSVIAMQMNVMFCKLLSKAIIRFRCN